MSHRGLRVSKLKALTLTAAPGSYAMAGVSANLVYARHLNAPLLSGVFQWSGFNANLVYTPVVAGQLTATAVIGGNVAGYNYFSTEPLLINMIQQSFCVNARDWQTPANATLVADTNGDPPQDFQVTPHWLDNPNGVVQTCLGQFTGWADSITSDSAHITLVAGSKVYTTATNTTTFTIRFDATWTQGNYHLIFTGTRRTGGATGSLGPNGLGTGVANLLLAHPGYLISDIAVKVWTDQYITFLSSFNGPLRAMDLQAINSSTNVNWTDVRRRATHKIGGPTYEDIAVLSSLSGRDLHIQVPHLFTLSAVDSFVDFFETNVNAARKILVGFSNETWNSALGTQFLDLLILTCVECKAFVGGTTTVNGSNNRNFSASRSGSIVTVTTGEAHNLTNGQTVYFTSFDGSSPTVTIAVAGATTFTFTYVGTNTQGALSLGTNTWFIGDLTSTLRLGSTIAADGNVNIFQLKNRYCIRQLQLISDRIRLRVGDAAMMTRWFPVWEDQMINNSGDEQFGDPPLRYLESKWTARAVNQYVGGLFGAPYVNADPLTETAGATTAQIVAQLQSNAAASKTSYKFESRIAVADYYGFALGAGWYEGGPDTKTFNLNTTDIAVRNAAMFDPTTGTAYRAMLNDWFSLGGGYANQYTIGFLKATSQNRDDGWGVTDALTDLTTAKLTAIKATIAAPPVVTRNLVPGIVDGRDYCEQFTRSGFRDLTIPHARFTLNATVAGTYRIIVKYTCNFAGDSANIFVGSTRAARGPFTFTNQGTGVAHNTLRTTPGPIALPTFAANLHKGANNFDIARTASMGDDVEIFSIDAALVKGSLSAGAGSFTMTGNAATLSTATTPTGFLASDFAARGTVGVNGVFYSTNFATQAALTGVTWAGADHIAYDTVIKRSGGGAARFNRLTTDFAATGQLRLTLDGVLRGTTGVSTVVRGNPSETWYQGTFYFSDAALRWKPTHSANGSPAGTNDGGIGGTKTLWISAGGSQSNQPGEMYPINNGFNGFPHVQYQNSGGSFSDFNLGVSTPNNSTNFSLSNGIDSGSPANPTTDQQYAQRHGVLYKILDPGYTVPNNGQFPNAGTYPALADVYAQGFPEANSLRSGLPRFPSNGWITLQWHVIRDATGGNCTAELYGARTGEPFKLIESKTGFNLDTSNIGHGAIWVANYDTNRDAGYNAAPGNPPDFMVATEFIASSQPIAAPKKPAWLTGKPLFQWGQIAGTALATAQTYTYNFTAAQSGSQAGITADSGMTLDPVMSELLVAGGGHTDSYDNGIYGLKLLSETPAWVMRRAPITNPPSISSVVTGVNYYSDGRPSSRHTSWNLQYVVHRNRIMFAGAWGLFGNGNGSNGKTDGFNLAANDYDVAGTWPDCPIVENQPIACATDPDGNIWIQGGFSGVLAIWQQSTGTWLNRGGQDVYENKTPFCWDPVRGRMVRWSLNFGRSYDFSGAGIAVTFSGAAAATAIGATNGNCSVVWCEERRSHLILQWGIPNRIFEAVSTSASAYTVTEIAMSGTGPTTVPIGIQETGHLYGRFNYVPELGIAVVMRTTSDDLFWFNVRPGGVYATSFAGADEAILSQNGEWGKPANAWQNQRKVSNIAKPAAFTDNDDDAHSLFQGGQGVSAVLTDVEIIATIFRQNATFAEYSLLGRMADTAGSPGTSRGYEGLCNTSGGVQIVKWNGPLHGFLDITVNDNNPGNLADGDQLRLTVIGSGTGCVKYYWRRPSVSQTWLQIAHSGADSTPFTSGTVGISNFVRTGVGNINDVGWRNVQITPL